MQAQRLPIALLLFCVLLLFSTETFALTPLQRLEALEGKMASLEAENTVLKRRIAELERVSLPAGVIGTIVKYVPGSINGLQGPHIVIEGANFHVRSGSGSTAGTVNGLGNLIVGYNEKRFTPVVGRGGSHNLVVGGQHEYSSYGGMVAGYFNTISNGYTSVTGGIYNTASGAWASVSGGNANTASSTASSVSGGYGNEASGSASSVSGGYENIASGGWSNVSGGESNDATGEMSSVSAGYINTASGEHSSVSGGEANTAQGASSTVSGGSNRAVYNDDDWKAGSYFSEW